MQISRLLRSRFLAPALLDKAFEEASSTAFNALVKDALPKYITYNLVKLASECLVNEVTGRQSTVMQSLIGGLSEVFCIQIPIRMTTPSSTPPRSSIDTLAMAAKMSSGITAASCKVQRRHATLLLG